jgi:hypothetical protein
MTDFKALQAEPEYQELLDNIHEMAFIAEVQVEKERQLGLRLWQVLEEHPHEHRLLRVKNDKRFQSWGLFEEVHSRVRETARQSPLEAADLAYLAHTIAEHLDPKTYSQALIEDFKAQAAMALGHAKKCASDFLGARAAYEAARAHLDEGTGDLLEKARLIVHSAGIDAELGEFEAAVESLNVAFNIYKRIDDTHAMGKTRLHQGVIIRYVDPLYGIQLAEEGLSLIDREEDATAELSGRYTLAFCYN